MPIKKRIIDWLTDYNDIEAKKIKANIKDRVSYKSYNSKSLSFRKKIFINNLKKINLTISYCDNERNNSGDYLISSALDSFLRETNHNNEDELKSYVVTINQKVEDILIKVFSSDEIERLFGSSFSLNILIYVGELRYIGIKGAGVSYIKKIFKKGEKYFKIEIIPTEKDIRIYFDIHTILKGDFDGASLDEMFKHELTHILDPLVQKKLKKGVVDYNIFEFERVRAESIAVFMQLISYPSRLDRILPLSSRMDFLKHPFARFADYYIPNKRSWPPQKIDIYYFGGIMALQIFLKFIEKKTGKIFLDEDLKIVNCLNDYKNEALTIYQMIKLMSTKKFFEYYQKVVDESIFDKYFFKELTRRKLLLNAK